MKIKVVEDENPGNERVKWGSTDPEFALKFGPPPVRNAEGRLERLPASPAPTLPGEDPNVREISNRTWWVRACNRQGHIINHTLTSSSAWLAARRIGDRIGDEHYRRGKMHVLGTFEWHGDCLVKLVARDEVNPDRLLTRDDLPEKPCATNPDGPCACKVRERAARQALNNAAEAANQEKFERDATKAEVQIAERSARAGAEAMAEAMRPILEGLVGATSAKRKKGD